CLARRVDLGEVVVCDAAKVTSVPCARAMPLWGAGSWRGVLRVGHWMAAGARSANSSGLADGDFWFGAAEKLLAPLLFAAASSGEAIEAGGPWAYAGPQAIAAASPRPLS